MTLLEAIVYGVVQGLGEFLPISSSAHLVLVPWLFGWSDPGLTFDVALHFGTLVAVVAYFWKDWVRLIAKGFTDVSSSEGRLFWYLAVATIPGAAAGFLLEEWAETVFREPLLIAIMLVVMGLLLYAADRWGSKKNIEKVTFPVSLWIGICQMAAIIPGVSRSGVTITAGLSVGLSREGAARFSFLLSMPIIFGAAAAKLPDLMSDPSAITTNFIVAVIVSCVTGFASIGFLLRYVQTRSFVPFVVYRLLLAAIVIAVIVVR